ncbi:DISARM system SNF2-like helicase DrmD [Sorangium sp. So ce367]|uniref:DISARM system SNF2-like helicase DrmD n=1 Tax=Sorangium sp. So ce367 TaxID=3133305 RepID=UPI003F5F8C7B
MEKPAAPPQEGQFVRVRARRYLVEKVQRVDDEDTAVTLACVDDDAAGATLEVLWERELDGTILKTDAFEAGRVDGFDRPDLFAAYLDTLRWSSVTSTDPQLFQAPYRAGISIKAHQLEPLRKALLLPRVNLLIADDVGLGKTIEAGLILRELLLRQRVRRVVVACPPSVVLQWRDELATRFGLAFRVLDRAYVLRVRRERGHATNPWATHQLFVVSHALLRDEAYAGLLRALLGSEGEPGGGARAGSLLILDEAHHAAPSSGAKYAVDSRFTRVIRDLAGRFEHRLFLSATPHNGHSNSFSALLEILDDTRFCRGAPIDPRDRDAVVVRRLKRDLKDALPGEIPERLVPQHDITGLPDNAPELELSRLLGRYRELRETRLAALPKGAQASAALVVTSLQKRLLSSIHAFARTLEVHRRSVTQRRAAATPSAPPPSTAQLTLLAEPPGMDDEDAERDEASIRAEEDAQIARATAADPCVPSAEEISLLDRMQEIAQRHRTAPDERIRKLIDWIREHLSPDLAPLDAPVRTAPKAWTDRRVLIFTEYADTKDYVYQQLRTAICEPERVRSRIRTFHGGISDEVREEIKEAFNADPRVEPLRILVCTDAAREGVNLQNHCADLFHFDLPWNPSRVEQRNGRIDRTLQRAPEVRCHYFVFTQRPEDQVLETIVNKTRTIQKELGSIGAVVEGRLAALLERGVPLGRVADLRAAIEQLGEEPSRAAARREELEAARRPRQLAAELADLRELLERARRHLDYEGDRLRRAVDAALGLLGAGQLEPVTANDLRGAYRFPDLAARAAVDPSWLPLLDLLRPPREPSEALWDWRRRTSLRSVVFEDPGKLGAGVVHLHLEHPLVRRLLARFSAQGFVHHDLHRACVLRTRAAVPYAILFGRVALYGREAARLHNEITAVAARVGGLDGREPLTILDDPAEPLALVREALADPALHDVDLDWARRTFLPSVPAHLEALGPRLKRRLDERQRQADRLLAERGKKEATALVKIVTDQAKRLERHRAELKKRYGIGSGDQLLLGFAEDERDQILDDLAYWDRRLVDLEPQALAEAARIREHYHVRSTRHEAVGLVYLWPQSG